MPNKASTRKSLRQSHRKHEINLPKKKTVRTIVRSIRKLAKEGNKDEIKKLLPLAYKKIDKAAKSYLHSNTAARKKSRLAQLVK